MSKITRQQLEGMKERARCNDCGNPWWFDYPQSWVCTTCAKTVAKATSEIRKPKLGETNK